MQRLHWTLGGISCSRLYRSPTSFPSEKDLTDGVTVAVPTWNGADLLPACLEAILAQTLPADRVIVVDNASVDRTEAVVAQYSAADYVRLEKNVGYSGAVVHVLGLVSTRFLAVVNNDAVPDASWLKLLVDALALDASLASAFPLSLRPDGRVDTAGDVVTKAGFFYKRGYGREPCDVQKSGVRGFCTPGVAPLYRVKALLQVGGWDASLCALYEDVELSLRLWTGGWDSIYVPEARVIHHQGSTTSRFIGSREFLAGRNEEVVLFKLLPWKTLMTLAPSHLAYNLLSFLSSLLRGAPFPFLAGKLAFLASLGRVLKARGMVTRRRQIRISLLEGDWLRTWLGLSRFGRRRAPSAS